jgi:membrane-associated phospholipid phosphatase
MPGISSAKVPAGAVGSLTGGGRQGSPAAASPGAVARYVLPRLIGGGVAIYAFLVGCGLLLTRVFDHSWLMSDDRSVSRWFVSERTPTLNSWTHFGSSMSDTPVAIALTVLLVAGLRLWLKRWRESIAIFLAIQGELFIFLLVTATVDRDRPSVKHLDSAPPTSSFPSGHTGAAVALYVGFAIILIVLSRNWSSRVAAIAIAGVVCLVPIVVGISRLYRGMHYLTDVLAGAVAGGAWMLIVMATVLAAPAVRWQRAR